MEPCAALLSALMECAILLQNTLMLWGVFCVFFFLKLYCDSSTACDSSKASCGTHHTRGFILT